MWVLLHHPRDKLLSVFSDSRFALAAIQACRRVCPRVCERVHAHVRCVNECARRYLFTQGHGCGRRRGVDVCVHACTDVCADMHA